MLEVQCQQGSPEWHQARAGVITGSMFKVARSRLKTGPNRGDFTSASKDYAFRLAVERISGEPLDEGFETWQMRRGHELEPAARLAHEIQTGTTVRPCGFVLTDDSRFGASADGFIGDDGGAEYKCLVAPEKLRQILVDGDISDYEDQVQGGLWITGRKFWHFCLYCPALASIGKDLTFLEIRRNESFIETLEEELWEFKKLVDQNEASLRRQA